MVVLEEDFVNVTGSSRRLPVHKGLQGKCPFSYPATLCVVAVICVSSAIGPCLPSQWWNFLCLNGLRVEESQGWGDLYLLECRWCTLKLRAALRRSRGFWCARSFWTLSVPVNGEGLCNAGGHAGPASFIAEDCTSSVMNADLFAQNASFGGSILVELIGFSKRRHGAPCLSWCWELMYP